MSKCKSNDTNRSKKSVFDHTFWKYPYIYWNTDFVNDKRITTDCKKVLVMGFPIIGRKEEFNYLRNLGFKSCCYHFKTFLLVIISLDLN